MPVAARGAPERRRPKLRNLWRSLLILLISSAWAAAADLRVVAPSAPGSGWDQLAQALKAALETGDEGRSVDVVNVPGSSGAIGLAQFLANPGQADLLVTGLTMLDAMVVKQSPVALEALTPVARLTTEYYAVVVPSNSALGSLSELKAALQTEPSKVAWAGGPTGGLDHAAASLLAMASGIPPLALNYVAFLTTGDAASAAAEGRVTAAFLPILEVETAVKAGQLRLLAIAASSRVARFDAVPTLKESGLALEFANWRGLVARPDLQPAESSRMSNVVALLAASPRWKELVASRGWQEAYLDPVAFAAFIRSEKARIKTALRAVGVLKSAPDER